MHVDFLAFLLLLQSILGNLTNDIIAALVLITIGIIVILLVSLLIIFIPAIIVAVVVWFLTGSVFLAGIAFLVVAVLSLLSRI